MVVPAYRHNMVYGHFDPAERTRAVLESKDGMVGQWFHLDEVRCKETGELPPFEKMATIGFWRTVYLADGVRIHLAKPVRVNSWWRASEHSAERARKDRGELPGYHYHAMAVDLALSGRDAMVAVDYCLHDVLNGWSVHDGVGIGIAQKGPHSQRFIHIDSRVGFALWSY